MAIKVDEKNVHVVALRAGEGKLRDLIAKRQAKVEELSEATIRYHDPRRLQIEIEAEALLKGESIKVGAAAKDLEILQREIQVLDAAVSQQSQLVDNALRGKYSTVVCADNRSRYVEIEKRIARAVQELAAANESEVIFFRELQDVGCDSIAFRPMRINSVGLLSDNQSRAAFHAREVQEYCPEAMA